MDGVNEISMIAGMILSLALSFIPKLKDKWDAMNGNQKRLAMGGFLAIASVGIILPRCLNLPVDGFTIECTRLGGWEVLKLYVQSLLLAAAGNQATFALTPNKENGKAIHAPIRN
jgi:hypothetical protein